MPPRAIGVWVGRTISLEVRPDGDDNVTVGNGESTGRNSRGIARQPVFDHERRLVGFELLYRGEWDAAVDDEVATLRTLATALAEVGLDNAVGPHRTYVHVTLAMLRHGWHEVLPGTQTVLQLLDPGPESKATVTVLRDVQRAGYLVGLDDYRPGDDDWILPHVDIVNVDVQRMTLAEMTTAVRAVHRWGGLAVAERIEDAPRLTAARHAGFDFLKGFHLGRPELVSGQAVVCEPSVLARLEQKVIDPSATAAELADLLDRDDDLRAAVHRVAASTRRFDHTKVRRIAQLVALAAEPASDQPPLAALGSPATCHWSVEPV